MPRIPPPSIERIRKRRSEGQERGEKTDTEEEKEGEAWVSKRFDFNAPAVLRKWPSMNNERIPKAWGAIPYLIREGPLADCIRKFGSYPAHTGGGVSNDRRSYFNSSGDDPFDHLAEPCVLSLS